MQQSHLLARSHTQALTLRATGQSKIEKMTQPSELEELVNCLKDMAEGVGFEPTIPSSGIPVFKTGALDHSANPPFRYSGEIFRSEESFRTVRSHSLLKTFLIYFDGMGESRAAHTLKV